MNKQCSNCGQTKPLSEFYRRRASRDERAYVCKGCAVPYARAHPADPNKKRASEKAWREAHSERRSAAHKDWLRRNPDKHRAHSVLGMAVHDGRIEKPSRCEGCGGEFPSVEIHGHHADYDKPLDVEWLCRGCHVVLHKEVAA